MRVMKTESRDCKEHGEYEARYVRMLGQERWSSCPLCLEVERMEEQKEIQEGIYAQRIKGAKIPERYQGAMVRDFVAKTQSQKATHEKVVRYVRDFDENLKVGKCLIMLGNVGTGKTMLACAMVNALTRSGRSCRYSTIENMIREIQGAYSSQDQTEDAIIQRFVDRDLLVLDEVGMQRLKDNGMLLIFEVINRRYELRRPTILCGNIQEEELDTCLGPRVVDRLREGGGEILAFDWESYRRSV